MSRRFVLEILVLGLSAIGYRPLAAQSDVAMATQKPRFVAAWAPRGQVVDARGAAVLQRRVSLDVARATFESVLHALARQARLDVSYDPARLPAGRTVSLHVREITMLAALTEVLVDTGLDVLVQRGGQLTLVPSTVVGGAVQYGAVVGRVTDSKTGQGLGGVDVSLDGTGLQAATDAEGRYRLPDVPPGSYTLLARRIGYAPERRPVTVAAGQEVLLDVVFQASPTMLRDVVVTAQKREERLINTPQAVSVLPADQLAQTGVTQVRDFASSVPGLTFSTAGVGYTQLSLRGVTTGFDLSPTVGIYVDEVPYGSSTAFTFGAQLTLDMGLFDIDRIEVQKGPQGTLYGASTMGGLLKYVTKQPNSTRFGVDVQAGTAATRDGGASANGAVAVNAPLVTDKAALRVSGFEAHDGGYIDNVALGESDVNRSDTYGGRADLLLTPTNALSIRLTGFLQNVTRRGEGTATYSFEGKPLTGALDQSRLNPEPFHQRFRLGSGTVSYDFGGTSLTSISSYQTSHSDYVYEYSDAFVPLFALVFGRSYSAVAVPGLTDTDKFTQEVRLASASGREFEWVAGGFYTHESSNMHQEMTLRDLAGEPAPNEWYAFTVPSRLDEYAAFADVTWRLTPRFDVTGGLRFAHNKQTFRQYSAGRLFPGPSESVVHRANEDVVTYLANARYHLSDDATLYARYATGYRPGGPNYVVTDPLTGGPTAPASFEADHLRSYELGFKGETPDRRFGVDLSAYYIDWNNIQILYTSASGFSARANAPGGAVIPGMEVAVTAYPIRALALAGNVAYQDAHMSEANANLGAADGERLPNVPRVTGGLSADYALRSAALEPTIGATFRAVSDRHASFDNSRGFPQYDLPAYTQVDLRAGITVQRINLQLYARNIFDERGQLSAVNARGQARPAIQQPRTVGVSATTHF